jgi:Cytochrome oxidase complex assembly protein 1
MQTPPPIPNKHSSGWMSRNAKWFVPALCLMALLFVAALCGLFVLGVKAMKSSAVYSDALSKAESAPAVTAALGTPLKDSFLFTGNISENDASGSAHFMIPISGPKGSGHLTVVAIRLQGQWRFEELTLLVDKTREGIDLLSTNQ